MYNTNIIVSGGFDLKTDLALAKNVFVRLLCCGILSFFIYFVFTALITWASTSEISARIYKIEDGKYTFVKEEAFEKKSEYTPPKGDDIIVDYIRSESALWVKIIGGILIQSIIFYQVFKIISIHL